MSTRHLLAVGVILAPALWLFAPALSGEAGFAFRDAAHYYHPLFQWMQGQWGDGRVPLWNPQENLGVALVAENTSSVFYPGKLLFALPLNYTLLYNLYIVVHVLLAALSSFRLARHWNASVSASALAAMSYAFSGNVLFQYCNVVFLVGAAWLPWAVQLADRMLRGRSWSAACGLGVVLALMITGGDPQMAYNAVLLAALYAALLWHCDRRGDTGGHPALLDEQAGDPPPRWRSRLLLWCASGGVCALLAAVQIMPTLEGTPASGRGTYDAPRNVFELAASLANPRDLDERLAWYAGLVGGVARGHQRQIYHFSVPPWRAAELVWPNIGGEPFPTDHRWLAVLGAEGNLWTPSLYMGLLPFVLAVGAWTVRRTAAVDVRFASWMVLFGGLASLGSYGVAWAVGLAFGGSELLEVGGEVGGLYWWMTVLLPYYVYFRYPAKLFVVAALGLSMLAARGWDHAWQTPARSLGRWMAALAVMSLVGLVVVAAGWAEVERRASDAPPQSVAGPFDAVEARRDIAWALVQTAVLSVLFLMLLHPRTRAAWPRVSAAALAVTAVDLALAQAVLLLYAPAEGWATEPRIVGELPERLADYRVYRQLGPQPPSWARTTSVDRYTESLRWDRETLWPKYELPYGVSLVEASQTMLSSDYQCLLDVAREYAARRRLGPLPEGSILDLLAARVAIVADDVDPLGMTPLGKPGEGLAAYVRPSALPRAWIVHEVEQLGEPIGRAPWQLKERTRAILFPGERPCDWAKVAVVESDEPPRPAVEPAVPGASERCTLVNAEPHRVELDVRLASAGLVVLGDLYYPGWELTVETAGVLRREPIVRTNRVMRGAFLPAGEHRLVYAYRPRSVYFGGAVSLATAVVLMAAALIAGIRRRSARPV